MTIDPTNITDYDRDEASLQAFWLFCLFVAGKNSDTTSRCLAQFLRDAGVREGRKPFDVLREAGPIAVNNMLVAARVGQYKRLSNAIADSLDLKLDTCTLEDLSNVSGAGPKTCRFFLLHTRKGCNYVVLDRHILGWLRFHGIEDAPRNTPPPGKQYEKYARIAEYLLPCAFPGMTMAQIDLLVWSLQSGRIQDPYELSNRKEFDALP